MELNEERIHNTVITLLSDSNAADKLKLIGNWFWAFISSDRNVMKLNVPFYDAKFTQLTFQYLRYSSLIWNLCSESEVQKYEDTCLFDIFNFSTANTNKDMDNYLLNYIKHNGKIIKWQNETITHTDNFLPVFRKSQINCMDDLVRIKNTFPLFAAIKRNKLINKPILINLNDKFITIQNDKTYKEPSLLNIYDEYYIPTNDLNEVGNQAERICSINADLQLALKYPYHNNIINWFIQSNSRLFEISFNKRFFYIQNKISEDEVILLPKDFQSSALSRIIINPIDYFYIYKTCHNQKIYELLIKIKREWSSYDFNCFTTPFPKYWLIFVNPIITVEEWVLLFKKCYPAVSRVSLINTINELIGELYNLDWIKNFIDINRKDYVFVFPELTGNMSKQLKQAYVHFQNHLRTLNNSVSFCNTIKESCSSNTYVLNSFDFVNVVNLVQSDNESSFRFLCPDFMYYIHNPWGAFQAFEYQLQTLINRQKYQKHIIGIPSVQLFEQERASILMNTKNNITNYNHNYLTHDNTYVEQLINKEDVDLINEEENMIYCHDDFESDKSNKYKIEIYLRDNESITLYNTDKIYVYKNSLLKLNANQLISGDFFTTNDDINTLINRNSIFEKLSDIPQNVLNYQAKLNAVPDVYEYLKKRGLKYAGGETYFRKNYCLQQSDINDDSFQLPRRRDNWRIICEYLGIESNVMNLAFIAYYGRLKSNQVKELYKSILEYLIHNELFADLNNPCIITDIANITNKYMFLFQQVEDINLLEITISIINTLSNEILNIVKEVKSLKIIE